MLYPLKYDISHLSACPLCKTRTADMRQKRAKCEGCGQLTPIEELQLLESPSYPTKGSERETERYEVAYTVCPRCVERTAHYLVAAKALREEYKDKLWDARDELWVRWMDDCRAMRKEATRIESNAKQQAARKAAKAEREAAKAHGD